MRSVGVLGGGWGATVSPAGDVQPWDGSPVLQWHVAADDRWHSPAVEPTVRQVEVSGAPVLETRVRIPNGDAVQRVYAVADAGGLVVVEVENDSPLPIAVAFTRPDVLTQRPPTEQPIRGIDLPSGSVLLPVGHHTVVRVALGAHDRPGARPSSLPAALPSAAQVVRGWVATCERASAVVGPDDSWANELVRRRSSLAIEGPTTDDPVERLIGIGELVRMGEPVAGWVESVAEAVERAAPTGDWALPHALDAAARVLAGAGERRAVRDVARLRGMRRPSADVPPDLPGGMRAVPWIESRLAVGDGATAGLLPSGFPPGWLGTSFECHGIPVGPSASLSYAVRWHGDRPAVLWELQGDDVELAAPLVAPGWRSSARSGEALWPAPVAV